MQKICLITFCLAISFSFSLAQEKAEPELHEFLIIIESTENGFKLSSTEGCAWTELSFSAKPYSIQFINQNGMTEEGKNETTESNALLFSISKTDVGLKLVGHKGTAWTKLKFSTTRQAINQFGMISP